MKNSLKIAVMIHALLLAIVLVSGCERPDTASGTDASGGIFGGGKDHEGTRINNGLMKLVSALFICSSSSQTRNECKSGKAFGQDIVIPLKAVVETVYASSEHPFNHVLVSNPSDGSHMIIGFLYDLLFLRGNAALAGSPIEIVLAGGVYFFELKVIDGTSDPLQQMLWQSAGIVGGKNINTVTLPNFFPENPLFPRSDVGPLGLMKPEGNYDLTATVSALGLNEGLVLPIWRIHGNVSSSESQTRNGNYRDPSGKLFVTNFLLCQVDLASCDELSLKSKLNGGSGLSFWLSAETYDIFNHTGVLDSESIVVTTLLAGADPNTNQILEDIPLESGFVKLTFDEMRSSFPGFENLVTNETNTDSSSEGPTDPSQPKDSGEGSEKTKEGSSRVNEETKLSGNKNPGVVSKG